MDYHLSTVSLVILDERLSNVLFQKQTRKTSQQTKLIEQFKVLVLSEFY